MHHEFQTYDYTNLRPKESLKQKFAAKGLTGDTAPIEDGKFAAPDQKQIDNFRCAAELLKDHLPAHLTDGVIYRFLYANDMDLDKARNVSIFSLYFDFIHG